MIIGLIILLVVAAVVIKIFMDKMNLSDPPGTEGIELDQYRLACSSLCQRYIDSDFVPAEALHYCEKYYDIDLNKNGKTRGEVGTVSGYGVSEDRVYCFNLIECHWGTSRNSRLTPKKCKDIMCDVYTDRQASNETAAAMIETKIPFGHSTDPYQEELIIKDKDGNPKLDAGGYEQTEAVWWVNSFGNVHCRG